MRGVFCVCKYLLVFCIEMKTAKLEFNYEVYNSSKELDTADAALLDAARKATRNSFALYSNFKVGAAAKLKGEKEIMIGSNQENASYPVSICAERGLLAAVAGKFGKKVIETMAISYHSGNGNSSQPIAPCGMCRQSLQEYEIRVKKPIRLILAGLEGKIFVFERASQLLPLGFTSEDLTRD